MNTQRYYIESYHAVYINDYINGESRKVNNYIQSAFITAETPTDALKQYFDKELNFSFDFKNSSTNQGSILYTNIVDQDNIEANEFQIKRWQNGEIILYSNYSDIDISEVTKTNIFNH